MAFVQRDWRGNITGLFAGRQHSTQEELPEDHAEVVEFRERHPVSPELLRPWTPEERAEFRRQEERFSLEEAALRRAADIFRNAFTELEITLSALLHSMLNPQGCIAYAIYYSVSSFEARCDLVGNALIQIASENPRLSGFLEKHRWPFLVARIRRVRNLRNALAHGNIQRIHIGNKTYVRYMAPAFDQIRVGRIVAKRQIPGMSANDIDQGWQPIRQICDCIDGINEIVAASHDPLDPTLPERFLLLEERLKVLRSQYPNAQTREVSSDPP